MVHEFNSLLAGIVVGIIALNCGPADAQSADTPGQAPKVTADDPSGSRRLRSGCAGNRG